MTNQVSESDVVHAEALLEDLQTKLKDVVSHVKSQCLKLEQGECSTAKGLSFLEVKNQTLLSYLINIGHIMLTKVSGCSLQGSPTISRLVELRTVLEKMKPIDKKLKYQVDKLVKTATTGTIGENDPLRFKPNPDNLVSKLKEDEGEGSEESSDDERPEKPNIYRPPKMAEMRYDGDETMEERKERQQQRAKKRALGSRMIQELRDEYYDGPEEIRETVDLHKKKVDKAAKEKQEYEETYFVRNTVTKKEKNAQKRVRTINDLNDLGEFGDISALTGEDYTGMPKKKRKMSSKGKKSKGFKGSKKKKMKRK